MINIVIIESDCSKINILKEVAIDSRHQTEESNLIKEPDESSQSTLFTEAAENESELIENDSDNTHTSKDLPKINIPIVKSRIGRPKGSSKPFWQLSKPRRSLSLKDLKRNRQNKNASNKKLKTVNENGVHKTEDDSQTSETENTVIEIDENDFGNTDTKYWIKNETVCLNMECKLAIESNEMLDA